jgi:hypothetical protein
VANTAWVEMQFIGLAMHKSALIVKWTELIKLTEARFESELGWMPWSYLPARPRRSVQVFRLRMLPRIDQHCLVPRKTFALAETGDRHGRSGAQLRTGAPAKCCGPVAEVLMDMRRTCVP